MGRVLGLLEVQATIIPPRFFVFRLQRSIAVVQGCSYRHSSTGIIVAVASLASRPVSEEALPAAVGDSAEFSAAVSFILEWRKRRCLGCESDPQLPRIAISPCV